jgi:hypothetical protein
MGAGNEGVRLSCPCCLTIFCDDCQRHFNDRSRWRAMFVTNCTIHGQPTKQEGQESVDNVQGDAFTVICTTCSTPLGVQDADEVYHFFGAIPSL